MESVITVQGMTCGHCKKAVETAVGNLQGVSSVEVNLDEGKVKVDYSEAVVSLDVIQEEIENQGYDVVK